MTALDAAAEVLRKEGTSLHFNKITDLMIDLGLWATTGKTPRSTVNSVIATEIIRKGSQSRFVRIRPGVYDLKERSLIVRSAESNDTAPAAPNRKLSFTDAAEQVLRQNDGQQPLHYEEITRRMMGLGLVETKGETPADTLRARISDEIRRRQKSNQPQRFVRLEEGLIGLANTEPDVVRQGIDEESRGTGGEPEPLQSSHRNRVSMTALDAAEMVLREAGTPLDTKSITDRILELGLWKTKGKTPEATVGARICSDLGKKDGQSRFRRVSPGVYGLNEGSSRTKPPIQNAPTQDTAEQSLSLTDAAERVLLAHDSKEPLHYQEIARRALKLGVVATKAEVPAASLNSAISSDIKRRQRAGREQRFVRLGGGLIGLAITDRKPRDNGSRAADGEVAPERPTLRNGIPMTALDAAVEVLCKAAKPLHVKSITDRILESGLWETHGKTPWWTVDARIGSEIATKGERSRFRRVKPAVYALSTVSSPSTPPQASVPTPEPRKEPLSYLDAAERILRMNDGQEPLHYREIARRIVDLALCETKAGTPAHALNVRITDEIRKREKANQPRRFVRLGHGLVGLANAEPEGVRKAIDAENRKVRDRLLDFLSSMDPIEFEHLVGELFSAMGAESVAVTRRSRDGGLDVRGTVLVGGAIPVRIAAHVKRWKHNVRSLVVDELRGSLGLHDIGLVVTTGRFSTGAREAAQIEDRKPVTLIDGDALVNLMVEYEIWVKRQQPGLLTLATPSRDRTKGSS